mmetsp:Transcript_26237/g.78237  ORF Transcript_26237/g.78237 Transcript_26237/m.78237 type:complete len:335 (+) Transcript_26237:2764-3768(+)
MKLRRACGVDDEWPLVHMVALSDTVLYLCVRLLVDRDGDVDFQGVGRGALRPAGTRPHVSEHALRGALRRIHDVVADEDCLCDQRAEVHRVAQDGAHRGGLPLPHDIQRLRLGRRVSRRRLARGSLWRSASELQGVSDLQQPGALHHDLGQAEGHEGARGVIARLRRADHGPRQAAQERLAAAQEVAPVARVAEARERVRPRQLRAQRAARARGARQGRVEEPVGPAVVEDAVAVRTQRHVAQAGHGELLLFWRHNLERHRGRREGARPPDRDNRHGGGLGELECERQLSAGDVKLPAGELHGLVLGVVDRDVGDAPGAREPDLEGAPGLEAAR